MIRVGVAIRRLDGKVIIHDGVEVVDNKLDGVRPEIILVMFIFVAIIADVRSSFGGQVFGFREAESNGETFVTICAVGIDALLEVEFALEDVVGDGDGDGTGVIYVGIGDGLNSVVNSDDLEARDGLEGESPRASGGEIVHGGYCEGVQLD